MAKGMKLPNGYGSVYKLKNVKRRKPWRARVTAGWELNQETGKVKDHVDEITWGFSEDSLINPSVYDGTAERIYIKYKSEVCSFAINTEESLYFMSTTPTKKT